MYEGQIVFSQLIELLPPYEFRKCVERYQGNYYVKSFSCWINSCVWFLLNLRIVKA